MARHAYNAWLRLVQAGSEVSTMENDSDVSVL